MNNRPDLFAYWLQGFCELQENNIPPTQDQWELIKSHLALVFNKVTPKLEIEPTYYWGIKRHEENISGGDLPISKECGTSNTHHIYKKEDGSTEVVPRNFEPLKINTSHLESREYDKFGVAPKTDPFESVPFNSIFPRITEIGEGFYKFTELGGRQWTVTGCPPEELEKMSVGQALYSPIKNCDYKMPEFHYITC